MYDMIDITKMSHEELVKFTKERRDKWNARLLELGFVAELHIIGPKDSWGGTLYLRNDGTFWGSANDGSPGLEDTGLARDDQHLAGPHMSNFAQGGQITQVTPLLPAE